MPPIWSSDALSITLQPSILYKLFKSTKKRTNDLISYWWLQDKAFIIVFFIFIKAIYNQFGIQNSKLKIQILDFRIRVSEIRNQISDFKNQKWELSMKNYRISELTRVNSGFSNLKSDFLAKKNQNSELTRVISGFWFLKSDFFVKNQISQCPKYTRTQNIIPCLIKKFNQR